MIHLRITLACLVLMLVFTACGVAIGWCWRGRNETR